jgi:hypothetical protein
MAGCVPHRTGPAFCLAPTIHRLCGQLCGKQGSNGAKPAPIQAATWFAHICISQFLLRIKHLDMCDSDLTGATPPQPSKSGPVEFSTRAGIGFAVDRT